MIKEESIAQVKDAADIIAVISDVVDLKKNGSSLLGLCPFHSEKTPSFNVHPNRGFYKCFGCGKSGDAIGFVMDYKRLSFIDSIKYLAGKFNIYLEYDSSHTVEEEDENKKADKALALTQAYFSKSLDGNQQAKDYLNHRGFSSETLAQWEIGYAPKEWSGITPKLVDANLFDASFKLGIVGRNDEKNRNYDVYRNRITIPIRNHFGRLLGFGGRILDGDDGEAKYINPKDSRFYHKQRVLFGLDKAAKAIRDQGFAYLVEGYFDVISMSAMGLVNTVASCGTAFTPEQAKLIKKYCQTLVICFDNDAAGIKAAKASAMIALEEGFKVENFTVTGAKDVDEWIRTVSDKPEAIHQAIEEQKQDVIYWIGDKLIEDAGEEAFKLNAASEKIAQLISLIPVDGIRDSYLKAVIKKYRLKQADFKAKLQAALDKVQEKKDREERKKLSQAGVPPEYHLPAEVAAKVNWNDLKGDVENYALFIFENRIYSRRGENTFYFKEVSNFSVKIIQHMEDEKRPMKLVQIENVYGRKRTFDAESQNFTSMDLFNRMMTNFGNFNWQGEKIDFQRLCQKLYDEMGDGRMIHVLGWQDESFFVFSNKVLFPDGTAMDVDQYGCFTLRGASYYIPSGNSIHAMNPNLFVAQKRVVFRQAVVPLDQYFAQVRKVHRDHAMNAILFTIATIFSDIVHDRTSFFPMLFLYGEASSGKDNLIESCQAFFGKSQSALTITGRANTDKAKIRKFAQMRNMIVHMSEYKNGNEDTDLLLMGLWDRRGYERANLDSGVGTEAVPILSSVIFTGNEYPTYDPLITRFIAEEMNKTDFTQEEKNEYEKLKEWIHAGVSSYTQELMKLRPAFESEFRNEFKAISQELKQDLINLDLADRMIMNAAVMGATLKLCEKNGVPLPFSFQDWKQYMVTRNLQRQSTKRQTGSVVSKWWDCFLEACKSGKDLIHQRDYKLNGKSLFINYKAAYNCYAQNHFKIFRSAAISKAVMEDKLKKDTDTFIAYHDCFRFGMSRSSAYEFNLAKIGIEEDVMGIVEYLESTRKYENSTRFASSSADDRTESKRESDAEIHQFSTSSEKVPF